MGSRKERCAVRAIALNDKSRTIFVNEHHPETDINVCRVIGQKKKYHQDILLKKPLSCLEIVKQSTVLNLQKLHTYLTPKLKDVFFTIQLLPSVSKFLGHEVYEGPIHSILNSSATRREIQTTFRWKHEFPVTKRSTVRC